MITELKEWRAQVKFPSVKAELLIKSVKLGKYTPQKLELSIKDFFSKCDQIRRKLHFLCIDICGVFRTLSNIYDVTIFRKRFTADIS